MFVVGSLAARLAGLYEWAADFDAGFGVRVGQPVPGGFDRFVPAGRRWS